MKKRTRNKENKRYQVTGTLYINHDGQVVQEEQIVRVKAIEVGNETALVEGLSNEKGQYSFTFEWGDQQPGGPAGPPQKGPNIQVDVFSFFGESLGQSEIHFQINAKEDIDLIINAPAPISEYERLQAVLLFILPGQPLTEKDIPVLLHSLDDYNRRIPGLYLSTVTEKNLEHWLHSQRLATESGLPGSFFYGIDQVGRRLLELEKILNETDTVLQKRFVNSVKKVKVPELDWGFIQKQLDELRFNINSLQAKQIAIQLISEVNKKPLEYFKVSLFQIPKQKDLGELWTDKNGVALFRYLADEKKQQFRLTISDFMGRSLLETEIRESQELISISVQRTQIESFSVAILDVANSVKLELPEGIEEFLAEKKIITLRDLLLVGGFSSMSDLPVSVDHPVLRRLDAHSELSIALSDYQPEDVEKLIDGGYNNVQKIASSERIRFVRQMGKDLGNYKAASLLKQAKATMTVLDNMLISIRGGAISGNDNPGMNIESISMELSDQTSQSCNCESCSSAVSPTAYLADLIKYAEAHLQVGLDGNNDPVMAQLEDLEAAFYQPFGDLPVSCEEVERKIRQVRLCIEVLRRYMDAKGLPAPGSGEESNWNETYRNYLETTYSLLLTFFSTSFEDLRKAIRSNNSDDLKAIAKRIGVPESIDLAPLFLDPDNFTEADLEHLFGLKDTTGDALSAGILMNDDGGFLSATDTPFSRWNPSGVRWRKNTDESGYIYLSVKMDATVFRVEAFKDANRSVSLAKGETDSASGEVILLPTPDSRSGLYGSIQLNYAEDCEDIKLSVVPLILSWRLQWLYQDHWFSDSDQAIIDPDLIGAEYLLIPIEDNPAIDLWQARKTFIEDKLAEFRNVSGNDDISRFNQLLTIVDIELIEDEDDLLPKELEFLQNIQTIISPPNASALLEVEWENVFNILVQVEKRRRAANWLAAESQVGIMLTPDFFKIPEFFADEQLPEWRVKWDDLRIWGNTLRNRLAERKELVERFDDLVDQAEEANLILIRDALIQASDATGDSIKAKAEWITDRLLINARMNSCMLTTRVAQAIDTLQQLVWSIHTGQLADTHPNWDILSDHFDEEWKWMGSYATWKAAMTVFLYPENVLHPTLRQQKTPAFERIIEKFRNTPRLTPQDACQEAREYESFLNDLPNLKIEATCRTRIQEAEKICGKSSPPTSTYRLFLFARAEDSGKVYMSSYRSGAPTGNEQTSWEVVPQFSDIVQIVGACVYEFEAEKSFRFIYIFAKEKQGLTEKLVFVRYDLEARKLEEVGPFPLDISQGATTFRAVIKQKNISETPPELAIQVEESLFFYQFNTEGISWEMIENIPNFHGPNQLPLTIKSIVAFDSIINSQEAQPTLFVVISSGNNGIFYNFFPTSDPPEFETERIVSNGKWKGTIFWPAEPNIIYLIYEENELLVYKAIYYDTETNQIATEPAEMYNALGTLPVWNDLDNIAVHTSANTQQDFTYQIAYQLKGENAGPYLGFFTRNSNGTNNSSSSALNLPENMAIESGSTPLLNSATLRWRVGNTGFEYIDDSMIIDPGGWDLPPLPPPEPPEPTVPENLPITFLDTIRLAPIIKEEIEIVPVAEQIDSEGRKSKIELIFKDNEFLSQSHLIYLEEGFYFIPIYIAINLQRRGFYEEALKWFRTVYDFPAPEDQRKIYYGLVKEETFIDNYERMINWLLDPLNPHAIAQNRPNTYSRFTLFSIIQCLTAFADAEFTKDTAESVSRASTLYSTALNLLQSLKPPDQSMDCHTIIMNLAQSLGSQDELEDAFNEDILNGLGQINNLDLLQETVNGINQVLGETNDWLNTLNSISRTVNNTLYRSASSRKKITEMSDKDNPAYQQVMRYPDLTNIIEEIAWTAEQDFDYTFSVLTGRKKSDWQTVDLPWLGERDQPLFPQRPLMVVENQRKIRHFETLKTLAKGAPNTILYQNQFIPVFFTPGNGFSFCIPPNPIIQSLQDKVELNIEKILYCRNIAGFERELEPYAAPIDVGTGLPSLLDFGGVVQPDAYIGQPTLFRYTFLVERAKQLANLAQQIETTFLSILEKRDAEFYNLLKAKQDVTLSFSNVRLSLLKVAEARDGIGLARLQRERTAIQVEHYESLLEQGRNSYEFAQLAVTAVQYVMGDSLSAISSMLSQAGNYERKAEEWVFAAALARKDFWIGNAQSRIAMDRFNIANQELNIANLQANFAQETLEFLTTKFTNLDLYEWMSTVLEDVYSTILQQATAVAQLSAQQLAFERQQPIPKFIQANYWEAPLSMEADLSTDDNAPDRKGLTGSARLLKDVVLLEAHAFDTELRKQQLTKTVSLAQFSPVEFQIFRETGKLIFDIPMELFDRDFPGHYLRLIKKVRISLIALVPPVDGIKASLSSSGISRVVVNNNNNFQEKTIQRSPEIVAYTVPLNATGQFDFELQQQNEMLRPFEGNGVAGSWELELPKPANNFDYNTIADALITFDYTAFNSDVYRQQVIQRLSSTFMADRAFSFRNEFADQWYDLNNPELSGTPMEVKFKTLRADFPANLQTLKIMHLVLYFLRKDGSEEVKNIKLSFTGNEWEMPETVNGMMSTRQGHGTGWADFQGKQPVGEWILKLPNEDGLKQAFKDESIEDILFIITYEGVTPEW